MLNRPNEVIQKATETQEPVAQSSPSTESQYGTQHDQLCLLLDIPAEVLAGITSHLDPPSLHTLGLVNKCLYKHVKDDGTWHRAFVQQFLGIDFQSELHDRHKRLLLRREAKTWRQEFITRFSLCKRWALSRNSTIRHIPVHSVVSSMHLMPAQSALLCASTFYGIVSRSLPLTGRILPGYLNPTGPRLGIGVGNPNVEFAPNVSTCLLTSEGGTAKALWGIRNGEVTITAANKAIDPSRRGVNFQLTRCLIDDEHEGPVLDAAWDGNDLAVTGGVDGRAKLWDTRTMRCLWSSEQRTRDLVIDPVVKVTAAVATKGIIACCTRSGSIVVFNGFEHIVNSDPKLSREWDVLEGIHQIHTSVIPCPVDSTTPREQTATCLYLDNSASPKQPVALVAYEGDAHFYKLCLDVGNDRDSLSRVETFGDEGFGVISCVCPFFAAGVDQCSFVLVGDRLGCISVYDWQGKDLHTKTAVLPVHRFEAHIDGSAVTAIHWNGATLITGSARGTTHVFDGLTFEELRNFPNPTPRFRGRGHVPPVDPNDDGRVRQILVNPDCDVLIVNVGNAILAWKAGPIGKGISGGVRGRLPPGGDVRKKKKNLGGKWSDAVELKQNIADSRHLLEQESGKKLRHGHGTAREHHESLSQLGLSEQEALEYVIMLSREDSNPNSGGGDASTSHVHSPSRPLTPQDSLVAEEGIFKWDTDDEALSDKGHQRSGSDLTPTSGSSSSSSERDDVRSSASFNSSPIPSLNTIDEVHFPPISVSPSPVNNPGLGPRSPSQPNITTSRSSAWGTPLKGPTISPQGTHSTTLVASSPASQRRAPPVSSHPASSGDDIDDDLRFVIELSLAEARSRGDQT